MPHSEKNRMIQKHESVRTWSVRISACSLASSIECMYVWHISGSGVHAGRPGRFFACPFPPIALESTQKKRTPLGRPGASNWRGENRNFGCILRQNVPDANGCECLMNKARASMVRIHCIQIVGTPEKEDRLELYIYIVFMCRGCT